MNNVNLNELVSGNQSIKVVPSIEDKLQEMGIDVKLDQNSCMWLNQLKATWKTWKKSATVEAHIELFYQSKPDPYRLALLFVVKCEDYKECKPKSLPYFLIETLIKWSHKSNIFPEDSLKLPAFHMALQQRNHHFLKLVVSAFQLVTIKDVILPIVRKMILDDNCKQASHIIIAMELYEDIPVEDLLFPLILQDKTNIIDEYLAECPSQVKPLLLFLDNLLDKSVNIREYVQDYIEKSKITHIRYDKVHHRPIGKLVARLCNKYNIPIETCKNLSKNRTTGGLRYLIHQKYQENKVSSSVWDDLVKDSLKQNSGSALEFIDMLVEYDRNEALRWASYSNIPEVDLPLALRHMSLQDLPEQEDWDSNVTTTEEYYKLSLSDDQIVIIDTGEKFYDLVISNLMKCNVVGIDCEWKPSFGATQSQVALIQIATSNNVYLIDVIELNNEKYASFWYTFYKSFLDNAEIIKIGFGLEQDLKEMKSSIIGLSNIKLKGEGLLDLSILWKSLNGCGIPLLKNVDNGGNSLSSLVQYCFGVPLEKSEQCSNWEQRPLRKTQVIYAAIDAYVLVEIYHFLQNNCVQQKINFEDICNDVMLDSKKKCSRRTKVIDHIQASIPLVPKSVHDVKLLIEPQLSHLMSYLKYCGIDTTVMSSVLWCDAINLAMSETRLMLCNKLKCTPTPNYSQSSILDIGKGNVAEQLQRVFTNWNIKIKQEDLLSFCIYCDEKNLKSLVPNEVVEICNKFINQLNKNIPKNCDGYGNDYEEDEDNYDNFLSDSDSDGDLYQKVSSNSVTETNMAQSCITSKGVPIQINDVHILYTANKPAKLCESCGILYWENDSLRSVYETIFNITKLKIW